jgi:O-antigen ligase
LPADTTLPQRTSAGLAPSPAHAGEKAGLPTIVWAYLICVLTPFEFFVGSVALTPLRVLLLVMVIPLTIRLFSGRNGKLMAVDYLFFAHMAWGTLAVAINNPNRVIENSGSAAVEFLGGYLVARSYIRTPDQFQALIRALLLLVFVLLPFSFPESVGGRAVIPFFIDSIPGIGSVQQVDIPKRMGLYRVQNVFAHPIHYGLFCSVSFSLVLLGLHEKMSLFWRLVGCGVICLSVFLSLSSGALLAVILQVGLLTWVYMTRKIERRWLLLVGMFALAYVVVDLLSNRTPYKVFMSYATFSSQTAYYRSIIFDWGMINVWNNPIFGLGLRQWVRPWYMRSGSVDNYWLVMAMKYGIPGFLLVVTGYFSALIQVGRANLDFSPRVSRLRLAWMITFCGLSFTMTTVHVWTAVYSFVFFFFGTGLWMATWRAEDEGSVASATPSGAPPARGLTYSRSHTATPPAATSGGPAYRRQQPAPSEPAPAAPGRPPAGPVYSRFADVQPRDTRSRQQDD